MKGFRRFKERNKSYFLVAILALIVSALLLFLSGCSGKSTVDTGNTGDINRAQQETSKPVELNVSAAMSLKDALQKAAVGFEEEENTKLIFNFGPAGELQAQIEQGAPADVFISAGKKQVDALEEKGLTIAGSRVNALGNDLVVVVPRDSKLTLKRVEDLAAAEIIGKISLPNPDIAPAGQYAKETLEKANIWTSFQSKLVLAKDVRQVIGYVETGNVDAGFVYGSDVKSSKSAKIALVVPDDYHKPIVYPAVILKDAGQPDLAAKFIAHIKSEDALKVFEEYGFKPIK